MATNPTTFPSLLVAAVSAANNPSITTTSGTNSGNNIENASNLTSMLDQYVAAASTAAAIQQVFNQKTLKNDLTNLKFSNNKKQWQLLLFTIKHQH